MANVNFMMDDYQYKMYGIHVEPDYVLQNSRCWQDIFIRQNSMLVDSIHLAPKYYWI